VDHQIIETKIVSIINTTEDPTQDPKKTNVVMFILKKMSTKKRPLMHSNLKEKSIKKLNLQRFNVNTLFQFLMKMILLTLEIWMIE